MYKLTYELCVFLTKVVLSNVCVQYIVNSERQRDRMTPDQMWPEKLAWALNSDELKTGKRKIGIILLVEGRGYHPNLFINFKKTKHM